jgi:hypothetical protein
LFGNAATPTATAAGGLFGGAQVQQAGQTQPAAGGLFGNTGAASGAFGSNPPTQAPGGTGLFGNTQSSVGGLLGNTSQTGGLLGQNTGIL